MNWNLGLCLFVSMIILLRSEYFFRHLCRAKCIRFITIAELGISLSCQIQIEKIESRKMKGWEPAMNPSIT